MADLRMAKALQEIGEAVTINYVEGNLPDAWTVSLARVPMIHDHFTSPLEGVEWLARYRHKFPEWEAQINRVLEAQDALIEAIAAPSVAKLRGLLDESDVPHRGDGSGSDPLSSDGSAVRETTDAPEDAMAKAVRATTFLMWLASLDANDEARREVTLSEIVGRAKALLGEA